MENLFFEKYGVKFIHIIESMVSRQKMSVSVKYVYNLYSSKNIDYEESKV